MREFRRVPADRPLRVIQVGAGGMGQSWLDTIAANGDVDLVGVVDLNADAAQAGAERIGASRTGGGSLASGDSLTRVAADTQPDAVIDVTVPVAHHPVTVEALSLGLPVLGEKPVAQTVAEGLSLAAASEVAGELFMVSQSRRYNAQLAGLKTFAGRLGRLGMVSTEFFKAPHFGGFRDEMPFPLLVDMAIHQFDMVRYLTGTDPVSVHCESFNPPWSWYRGDAGAVAVFAFDSGLRYTFTGTWCSPGAETSWNGAWRVSGEQGTALWSGDDQPTIEAESAGASGDLPDAGAPEGLAGSLAEFVSVLRSGDVPQGEVHSNIVSLAMVEAAVASAQSESTVRIADLVENSLLEAIAAEKDEAVRERMASWPSAAAALQ